MKKSYFYFVAVTAAASVAVSCNSELEANLSDDLTKHTIIVESEAPTKTYIDEGAVVHWAKTGDELGLVYRYTIEGMLSSTMTKQTGGYSIDAEGRAKHTVEISIQSGASEYRLMAFYPYTGDDPSSAKAVELSVPESQTPVEGSYDPKADCLISTNPKHFSTVPDKVSFSYHRPIAIAKMTLSGIAKGEKISKIEFTATENIAGSFTVNLWDENLADRVIKGSNYKKTITLDMQDRVATGSDVVYFTTLPADLSGKSFSVKVTTDGHIYSKDVALTDREFKLEAATLTKFVVADMIVSDLPSEFALLRDASTIKAGDRFVLCNTYYAGTGYLLGSDFSTAGTGRSGLAKTEGVTITDEKTILEENLPSNAVVFELEKATSGRWYLKSKYGYLYAEYVSSTSKLCFTKNREDEWKFELGSAYYSPDYTILTSNNCNYVINYSSSNSAFYVSSSAANYVYAYVLPSKDTPEGPTTEQLATPAISNVSVDGSSVTISWTAVEGAEDYDVKLADGYAQTGVTATEYTFTNVPDGTYPASGISVIANPASTDEAHASSAPASWSSDVVVKTTPDVGTETKLTFNLIDYYKTSSSVGDIEDVKKLITISHSGTSSCAWRTKANDGYDGIFYGSNHDIKVKINDSSKKLTKIVLYACVESGSYKTINIKTCEAFYGSGTYNYKSSNGQYIWSEGNESNYVKFTTGGGTYLSKIEVTYK
ncbi:MAG: hypothetical protein SOZ21_03460 [Candidatus Cryptobacteroides sp.]|nr:hypothetical protein [Candidatus Cryptobacteroides sp.]